jgi:hypothetical protein
VFDTREPGIDRYLRVTSLHRRKRPTERAKKNDPLMALVNAMSWSKSPSPVIPYMRADLRSKREMSALNASPAARRS